MFGKNPIMKQELTDGRALRVVEGSPFYTIQGEGPFAGHPAVFVRLHGCNLRCWFCDTEFSNPADPDISVVRLARLIYDEARMHGGKFRKAPARLVVLTGGEPLRQNIIPLVDLLMTNGYDVQIETAGSLWIDGLEQFFEMRWGRHFHIVCSPKTGKVHDMIKQYASCFKYVVGTDTQVDGEGLVHANTQLEGAPDRQLAEARPGCPVYLSPMDEYDEHVNAANRKRVGSLCLKHGYIAGVQMHKLMEIQEP